MKAQETASNLIMKFGKIITLSRQSKGIYDPATGELPASSISNLSVKALVKDYKPTEFISGTIETGDKKVTLAALNLAQPNVGDKVTIDLLDYTVIAVKTTWSGELAALYELQVRK